MNSSNRNKTPVSSSPRLSSLTRLWSQKAMGVASSSFLSPRDTRECTIDDDIDDASMHGICMNLLLLLFF